MEPVYAPDEVVGDEAVARWHGRSVREILQSSGTKAVAIDLGQCSKRARYPHQLFAFECADGRRFWMGCFTHRQARILCEELGLTVPTHLIQTKIVPMKF